MECLHPFCPMGTGLGNWNEIVDDDRLNVRLSDRSSLIRNLQNIHQLSNPPRIHQLPTTNKALLRRLLDLCPCLFNQLDIQATPKSIIHFCEITIGRKILSPDAFIAFEIQHPSKNLLYRYPPIQPCRNVGEIMEMVCSEVLTNEGIPLMKLDNSGWPIWEMPGHISLNSGKMRTVKAFGDILLPAAPTNLIISVKTEAARERLLYSANMIEGIGFGFFNEPSEFWTENRMNLFKRMGFSAIYLPKNTLDQLYRHLEDNDLSQFAVNINGTALYRSLENFGPDMRNIVGRITLNL